MSYSSGTSERTARRPTAGVLAFGLSELVGLAFVWPPIPKLSYGSVGRGSFGFGLPPIVQFHLGFLEVGAFTVRLGVVGDWGSWPVVGFASFLHYTTRFLGGYGQMGRMYIGGNVGWRCRLGFAKFNSRVHLY